MTIAQPAAPSPDASLLSAQAPREARVAERETRITAVGSSVSKRSATRSSPAQ
jgi:hypothetical protein